MKLLIAIFVMSSSSLFSQITIEYRFDSVDNNEFKEALESGEFILLDIRTIEEYNEGHIERSKLVVYNDGDMDAALIDMPKHRNYLVYSSNGVRSKVAMERMKELDFQYVLELDKGLKEWK